MTVAHAAIAAVVQFEHSRSTCYGQTSTPLKVLSLVYQKEPDWAAFIL